MTLLVSNQIYQNFNLIKLQEINIKLKLAWDWNWRGEGGRSRAVITAYNFNLKNPMSVVRLLICSAITVRIYCSFEIRI